LPYETGNPDLITDDSTTLQIPEAIRMMKILIVDDEEYNRMLFRVILSRWQVRFEVAENGKEAIDMIRKNHYDMVFMDARMPVMDGLKTTSMIRGELGLSSVELPVIGISATHTAEDLKKYKSAGMNSFMPKPFTERILLETMITLQKQEGVNEDDLNASQTPLVNLDNLYHLANHDVKFIRQMLVSFIETTEHGLNSLLEAVEKEDYITAGEVAHKISSPCKHLGANSLYNNLKSIEEQVGKMVNLTILADLSRVSSADFRKIKKELEDHLSKMEALIGKE
jgi:CheY-like chemotaxis protein/HPt (histidine-containing phosphotransfer) domain-containing protein